MDTLLTNESNHVTTSFKALTKGKQSAAGLLLFILCNAAIAVPVTWTPDVTLNDYYSTDVYSLNGSFDFDTATNSYSNIDLQIVDSYGNTTFSFSDNDLHPLSDSSFLWVVENYNFSADFTDAYSLQLFYVGSLQNGDIYEEIYAQGESAWIQCFDTNCATYGELAVVTAGSSISAVPVPAAAWLFGSALIGMMGIHRRCAKDL